MTYPPRSARRARAGNAAWITGLALSWAAGCGGGDGDGKLNRPVGRLIEERTVVAGDVARKMSLGAGAETTEVTLPAGILPEPTPLTVRLMGDVIKMGAQPAGPSVQMANKGVTFDMPATMEQSLPAAPAGMQYVGVHAKEGEARWSERRRARAAAKAGGGNRDAGTGDDDAGATGDDDGGGGAGTDAMPAWQIDIDGSGLWAMALVPISGGGDGDGGGTGEDDGGTPSGQDGGPPIDGGADPALLPQLTQLVPAQGTAGTQVTLTIHGGKITAGWTINFDGQPIATTTAVLTDGTTAATGVVTLAAAVATGQAPVWLSSGALRSNTLYFIVTPVAGAPTIVDYTPDNALPGATVAVIGTNFATEPVTIRDPLGRVLPVVTTGITTWVGISRDRVDIVIPADMPSGVLTATNTKGSFRGRVFTVGQNLSRMTGATATSSTQYNTTNWSTASGWDNNLQTSWFSANGDCATLTSCTTIPYFQVGFATPQSVARIAMRGNREYAAGYDFTEGWFEVTGADGASLWKARYLLPQPDRDLDIVFPAPIAGAAAVRFTSIADESVEPGFSELEVFAP